MPKEKNNPEKNRESQKPGILIAPWITEAATLAAEFNKYIFKVGPKANKGQIKKEIEDIYKVKVLSVNTVKISKKFKNYGRTPGWKTGFKKAIVTVKEGDKIELFKGV
jgi:large subunit ribosomal protein L23